MTAESNQGVGGEVHDPIVKGYGDNCWVICRECGYEGSERPDEYTPGVLKINTGSVPIDPPRSSGPLAPGISGGSDERLHIVVTAPLRNGGEGYWCDACSHDAGDYVWPCLLGVTIPLVKHVAYCEWCHKYSEKSATGQEADAWLKTHDCPEAGDWRDIPWDCPTCGEECRWTDVHFCAPLAAATALAPPATDWNDIAPHFDHDDAPHDDDFDIFVAEHEGYPCNYDPGTAPHTPDSARFPIGDRRRFDGYGGLGVHPKVGVIGPVQRLQRSIRSLWHRTVDSRVLRTAVARFVGKPSQPGRGGAQDIRSER